MSETDQLWNDEDDEMPSSSEAFSDALASLEDELKEHQVKPGVEDETAAEAEMYEEGVYHQSEINENGDPAEVSYADLTEEDAYDSTQGNQSGLSLGDELEMALAEPTETFDESSTVADDDSFLSDDEPVEETFADDYPAYEEEPPAVVEEAPAAAAASFAGGHEGTDDFNLATLTQLVSEIRQESDRVSEMKASVARALNLIQEMSESLKS